MVRVTAFQAVGRGFESRLPLKYSLIPNRFTLAQVAQLAEHILGKDEVTSSILVLGSPGTIRFEPRPGCGCASEIRYE